MDGGWGQWEEGGGSVACPRLLEKKRALERELRELEDEMAEDEMAADESTPPAATSFTVSLSLSLSLTHTHTLSLSLSLSLFHSFSLSLRESNPYFICLHSRKFQLDRKG